MGPLSHAALPGREEQDDFAAVAQTQIAAMIHRDVTDATAVAVAELALVGVGGALPLIEGELALQQVQAPVGGDGCDGQRSVP